MNGGRIATTHTGSLPRPPDLVAMLNRKGLPEGYDRIAAARRVSRAVSEVVRQQVEVGIDIIGDGEHSKVSWMEYARSRLGGLEEIDLPPTHRGVTRDEADFPSAY